MWMRTSRLDREGKDSGLAAEARTHAPALATATAPRPEREAGQEAGAGGASDARTGDRAGAARLRRNAWVFGTVACVWLALDALTKAWFSDALALGQSLPQTLGGLVGFKLVHNTGAAWSLFDGSTLALGIVSCAVCAFILVAFCVYARKMTLPETIGLALVLAGGVGNALNRFLLGYVIDFIQTLFVDFPIFNVADIGVTCGCVIVVIAFFFHEVGGAR